MRRGTEQVQTMLVDPTQVFTIQSDAVTVEEFENLDGDLPAIIEAVAKLRGREDSILGVSCNVNRDAHHFLDGRAQEKMVMRYFVSPSQAPRQFEKPTDIAFRIGCRVRDIANTGWPETGFATEKGRDGAPGGLVFRRQPHAVCRESYEGAVENDLAACAYLLERDGEGSWLQPRLRQKPQLLPANPL